MLCFTKEDEARLARGYPHLIELTDDLDPKKAAALAEKAGYDVRVHYTNLRVRFPRTAAPHFVRGARSKEFHDWTRRTQPPPSAYEDGSPVSADEARELVRLSIKVPGCSFNGNHRAFFYVLEELVGTEVVVSAMLDALEALPDRRFTQNSSADRKTGDAAYLLGFMFERLAPKARASNQKRMRALLGHARALCAKARSTSFELVCPIEEVLEGWAATRVARKPNTSVAASRYTFATEDLDRLRGVIADKNTFFDHGYLDVRFVRLLGPDILESLGKCRPPKESVQPMFEDLGMIKHPAVVSLFLEYVGKPMAKKLPLEWFRAHADYARPILQASRSDKAKAMLASL